MVLAELFGCHDDRMGGSSDVVVRLRAACMLEADVGRRLCVITLHLINELTLSKTLVDSPFPPPPLLPPPFPLDSLRS